MTHNRQRCSMGAPSWQHDMCLRWGWGRPDVVLPPWGINSITHTAGGGKKGEKKGRRERVREKRRRQTGSRDLTTQCCQSFLQARTNKEQHGFKAFFKPPDSSQSLTPTTLVQFFCTAAMTVMGNNCGSQFQRFAKM